MPRKKEFDRSKITAKFHDIAYRAEYEKECWPGWAVDDWGYRDPDIAIGQADYSAIKTAADEIAEAWGKRYPDFSHDELQGSLIAIVKRLAEGGDDTSADAELDTLEERFRAPIEPRPYLVGIYGLSLDNVGAQSLSIGLAEIRSWDTVSQSLPTISATINDQTLSHPPLPSAIDQMRTSSGNMGPRSPDPN